MSHYDFVIKRNDRLPTLVATLKDALGATVDLTGATAKFLMREVGASVLKVNTTATIDPDQVVNKGKVSYAWGVTDADTAGVYEGEFEITFGSGLKQTFNNGGHFVISIGEDLG